MCALFAPPPRPPLLGHGRPTVGPASSHLPARPCLRFLEPHLGSMDARPPSASMLPPLPVNAGSHAYRTRPLSMCWPQARLYHPLAQRAARTLARATLPCSAVVTVDCRLELPVSRALLARTGVHRCVPYVVPP
jgi:hypothetical protein